VHDVDGVGGFCQPSKLSEFIATIQDGKKEAAAMISTSSTSPCDKPKPADRKRPRKDSSVAVDEEEEVSASKPRTIASSSSSPSSPTNESMTGMSGQVCRLWLKHHYLTIGSPCDHLCGRKHVVTGKAESLYQDFAFKGLRKKHQQAILAAIREERRKLDLGSNPDTSLRR
jgi:hypothetical protein